MNLDFKSEESELLSIFLDQYIFNKSQRSFQVLSKASTFSSHINDGPPTPINGIGIELIVRPECNQKCQYCYIARYGEELYPVSERVSNEQILNNLDIFLNYIFNEKQIWVNRWELFAGDMFYDNLIFDILDIFYKYLEPIHDKYLQFFLKPDSFLILIPCNCSFVQDNQKVSRWREYIKKFSKFNATIALSYSGDGQLVSDYREQREMADEFYEKLFDFLEEFKYLSHPMLSPENVHNWIENYDWWIEKAKQYYLPSMPLEFQPMILEVRNDEWTDDNIEDLLKVIKHIVDVRLNMCENDIDHLAYHLFSGDGKNNTLQKLLSYDLIELRPGTGMELDKVSCSIQGLLHVQLNNLTIVPCHRTSYRQFQAGRFVVEDGHITGVEAENVTMFLAIMGQKAQYTPKCIECPINALCSKGCFGAQYEVGAEIFQPALSVCKMKKAKIVFLIAYYKQLGVLDSALRQGVLSQEHYNYYMNILDLLGGALDEFGDIGFAD